MTDYESDLDMSKTTNLLTPVQKKTKIVSIEKDKKWTTSMMIKDALIELRSRKGVSVYAIKKHLAEKFQVDTERLNYVIRKTLKTGVEDGTFVQLKGVGASGSFKLAVVKEKVKKTIKKKKPEKTGKEMKELKKIDEKTDKVTKKNKKEIFPEKEIVEKTKQKNLEITTAKKKVTKEVKAKKTTEKKKKKPVEETNEVTAKKSKTKMAEPEEKKKEKKTKTKMAQGFETPKKKGNMMKRRSIGSIRKPPKMKPK